MLDSGLRSRWVAVDDIRACWDTFERLGRIRREDVLEPGRCSAFMVELFGTFPASSTRTARSAGWRCRREPDHRRARIRAAVRGRRRRLIAGGAFALLTIAASVLVARRLTHSSWPLDARRAVPRRGGGARLPRQLRLPGPRLAQALPARTSVPTRLAASPPSAPARKRRGPAVSPRLPDQGGHAAQLGGIRVGLGAIALSIVSLGMIDAIAMLPLSISATATSNSLLRGPLLIVVAFGVGCCTLLVVERRLRALPAPAPEPAPARSRRARLPRTRPHGRPQDALVAWFTSSHAGRHGRSAARRCSARSGSASPGGRSRGHLSQRSGRVIPITSGGAVVNAGAAAAILLTLGVGKDIAINFSLASGLLLVTSAVVASICGVLSSLAIRVVARRASAVPSLGVS